MKAWVDTQAFFYILKAVKHASKSVKNIRSVYVQDQSAIVKSGEVTEFRVNLKITFEVE
jgi:flavin-binding protein dodecin